VVTSSLATSQSLIFLVCEARAVGRPGFRWGSGVLSMAHAARICRSRLSSATAWAASVTARPTGWYRRDEDAVGAVGMGLSDVPGHAENRIPVRW
jgi:hypothetical protein